VNIISVRQVTKTFYEHQPNEFTAVKEISIDIAAGGTTVLAGPSGSGKTTLLALMGLISRPTSGRISILGKETSLLGERLRTLFRRQHVGFIFQHFQLIGDLNARDNLDLVLYQEGLPLKSIRARRDQLLERFGLLGKASYKAAVLSGGEKQRLAIARSLMNDPEIVLVDEPTAHLDTALSLDVIELFRQLNRGGKTLVIASHDPLVVNSGIAARIIDLRDGRVVQES